MDPTPTPLFGRQVMHTTAKQIVEYWSSRVNEADLSVDFAEAGERCWRCAHKGKLQRCHIVPDSLGGPDQPSNFVLLCLRCHREAPNTRNADFMWQWLKASKVDFYDTYWTLRGSEEFFRIFKRQPFKDFTCEDLNISPAEVGQLVKEAVQETIVHFGEVGLNPATIAAVFADVEAKIRMRPKET